VVWSSFITSRDPNRTHRIQIFWYCCCFGYVGKTVVTKHVAMDMAFNSSSYTACINYAATDRCLVKRRLTMYHSGFQASCHNIDKCICRQSLKVPSSAEVELYLNSTIYLHGIMLIWPITAAARSKI
jgi:hypothetical protein